jgi:hypothetical protein
VTTTTVQIDKRQFDREFWERAASFKPKIRAAIGYEEAIFIVKHREPQTDTKVRPPAGHREDNTKEEVPTKRICFRNLGFAKVPHRAFHETTAEQDVHEIYEYAYGLHARFHAAAAERIVACGMGVEIPSGIDMLDADSMPPPLIADFHGKYDHSRLVAVRLTSVVTINFQERPPGSINWVPTGEADELVTYRKAVILK